LAHTSRDNDTLATTVDQRGGAFPAADSRQLAKLAPCCDTRTAIQAPRSPTWVRATSPEDGYVKRWVVSSRRKADMRYVYVALLGTQQALLIIRFQFAPMRIKRNRNYCIIPLPGVVDYAIEIGRGRNKFMANMIREHKILWLVAFFLFSINIYLTLGGCDKSGRIDQTATSGCVNSSQGTPK